MELESYFLLLGEMASGALSFAHNLFRDTGEVLALVRRVAGGQGAEKGSLTSFAAAVKRCRQTSEDWELFASLDDTEMGVSFGELNSLFNQFASAAVHFVKDAGGDLEQVVELHRAFCSSLSLAIGEEATTEIKGLRQALNRPPNSQSKPAEPPVPTKTGKQLTSEAKALAMPALVQLKSLSEIVIHSIRSRESTASHFAQAAKEALAASQSLERFAVAVRGSCAAYTSMAHPLTRMDSPLKLAPCTEPSSSSLTSRRFATRSSLLPLLTRDG